MNITTVTVVLFAVYVSYNGFSLLSHYWEHLRLGYDALRQLQELPQEHIDDFFEAYKRLSVMSVGGPSPEDKKAVADYYRVLNIILTAGVVMEIMLLPPVIDRKQGI